MNELKLYFSDEEMENFLSRNGYRIEVVKVANSGFDSRYDDESMLSIKMKIAYLPEDDIKSDLDQGSYSVSIKYGIDSQFRRVLKHKLLN